MPYSNGPGIWTMIFIVAFIYYGTEWLRKSGWGKVLGGVAVLAGILMFIVQSLEMLARFL